MSAARASEPRWAEIDGIRGILSIIVVLGHVAVALGVWAFAGMQSWYWMPMDVFFAISGFLLGRIVIVNLGRPGFLKSYFIRRMLRIWPAYYSVVLVVSLVALFGGAEHWPFGGFLKQLTFLQFTEYIAFAERGSYLYALLHTWSVAIEEHFYALLPLIASLLALRSRPAIAALLMTLALASVYLRLVESMHAWVLLTRAHSFAFGLLAAYLTLWADGTHAWSRLVRSRTAVNAFGIVTLLCVFSAPVLPYERLGILEPSRLRWVCQSVSAAAFAMFLLIAIYHSNLGGARGLPLLRNRVLTHLGEISYSTYLWHWPLFVALSQLDLHEHYSETERTLLALAAVLVVANLSYYGVERPFLRLKRLWAYGGRTDTSKPIADVGTHAPAAVNRLSATSESGLSADSSDAPAIAATDAQRR